MQTAFPPLPILMVPIGSGTKGPLKNFQSCDQLMVCLNSQHWLITHSLSWESAHVYLVCSSWLPVDKLHLAFGCWGVCCCCSCLLPGSLKINHPNTPSLKSCLVTRIFNLLILKSSTTHSWSSPRLKSSSYIGPIFGSMSIQPQNKMTWTQFLFCFVLPLSVASWEPLIS